MRDFIAHLAPQSRETQKLAHELHHCGSYLVFRDYLERDLVRLHAMRSCRKHLLCPLCAIRRGAKMLARYGERLAVVLGEHVHLRPYMATLTVRDGGVLTERYRHLARSLKAFHRRRLNGVNASEAQCIAGAVWSFEVKRGSGSGLWHPHVHAVWLCDREPNAQSLAREWHEITGDSHQVDVHAVHGELHDACCEVFKYALKFAGLALADTWSAYHALATRRLIGSLGVLWGVEVGDDLTDDAFEGIDAAEYVELCYRFYRGHGYARVDSLTTRFAA